MATKKLGALDLYQGTLTGEAKIPATISATNYNLTLDQLKAFFIAAGTIVTEMIANGAITHDKLASLAVGTGNIALNAVTSEQIANSAVTTQKLADGAVSSSKLSQALTTLLNGLIDDVRALSAMPIDSIELTNDNGSLKIGIESLDGNFRNGVIQGVFKIYGNGLLEAGNSISIQLKSDSGLVVDASGIAVSPKTDSGVIVDSTGVSINTATDADIDAIINSLN